MKCMLLAAGLGTRLRPITGKFAKPAVEMLNVPLFFYSSELIKSFYPQLVVANIHHHPAQIENLCKKSGFKIQLSRETEKPLGSGGGIKHAQKILTSVSGPILAINADNVLLPDQDDVIGKLFKFHEAKGDPLATLLTATDDRVGKEFNGVWFNQKGHLEEVAKTPKNSFLKGFHFTGVAIYSDRIFNYLPDGESNVFQDALLPAIQQGEEVYHYDGNLKWFETGDIKSFLATTKALLNLWDENPFLMSVIKNHAADSIFNEKDHTLISNSAVIAPSANFKSFAVVGSKAEIAADCVIDSSVVLSYAKCKKGQSVSGQIVY
jgi:mannose-1-phosphate guanylyltransferase